MIMAFTVKFLYHPDDSGYFLKSEKLRGFAWGDTLKKATDKLLDAVLPTAKALVDAHHQFPHLRDPRLRHAQFIAQLENGFRFSCSPKCKGKQG